MSDDPEGADSPPQTQEDNRDPIFYPSDTERPLPLLRKLGGNVLLDQKEIWTSPLHMNRHNAGLWLGFAAITGISRVGVGIQPSWVFTRATAYAITNSPADVIIGTSPHMTNWKYW